MKKNIIIGLLFLICTVCYSQTDKIKCYYSPQDNLEKIWIDTINMATGTIYISCFGISNDDIANALIDKHKKGIKIIICCDKRQANILRSSISMLKRSGIKVVIKKTSILEHNKMISVDCKYGIIGSYNLSKSAQRQDNSLVWFDHTEQVKSIEDTILFIYNRDKKTK